MPVLCRWILVWTLLLASGVRLWAAGAPDPAFDAAFKAFQDTFYDRAEAQFAEYCQRNPASPHLGEALLLQAQARLNLTNYAGAIELLTANQGKAGTNADLYQFWLGKAYLGKGDWHAASDTFARLVKEQPASSRLLEASLGEALARSALARTEPAEWQRVISLLQETNGVFQTAARTNTTSELVPRAYLLLSEAQLAMKDYRAAEATLQPLASRNLSPSLAWQWQYVMCRAQAADGQTNAALQGTTNLIAIAAKSAQTNLVGESVAFRAELLERLGQTNEALVAFQGNLVEGISAERQRQAVVKVTELCLAQDKIPQAAQVLEAFVARAPKAASADLALLTLGELRLRQWESGTKTIPAAPATTNAPATTDVLQLAMGAFETLVKEFPQSPFFGKAQFDLGSCYAKGGRLAEAQAALQAAVDRLPSSKELATAYFRLADTQFQLTNYAGALKSYQAILDKFAALPDVKTNLFEPVLYQSVRAGLAGGDFPAATNAMKSLLEWYPRSLSAASAVLLAAQDISRRNDAPAARKLLTDFDQAAPDAPLRAERLLAAAATWEREKNWAEAIAQYDGWLTSFTNHQDRPQAEYHRAWDTFYAGHATNALTLFAGFVDRFPTDDLARLARMWVATHYFNLGDNVEAERNYKLLFQNTNWPPSELTYQAQLMAGHAAVRHQDWKSAETYFTQLYNNKNGPSNDLRLAALLAHGRTLMLHLDPAETNRLANVEEATKVFGRVYDENPTNRLALEALLEKAKCYKEWALARQQYDSLTNALNTYDQVLHARQADVVLRSEAKVGMAVTLSKWADQKAGKERTALLEQALNHCLDVVYGNISVLHEGERLDQWWTKEAGVKAFDIADALQAWSQEVGLYQRLTNSVWPQLDASIVKRFKAAQDKLEREKASH